MKIKLLLCMVVIILLVLSLTGCTLPNLEQPKRILTIVIEPLNAGIVGPPPGEYNDKSQLGVQATPYSGYQFDHWDGDIANSFGTPDPTQNPIPITMDRDRWIKAVFVTIP